MYILPVLLFLPPGFELVVSGVPVVGISGVVVVSISGGEVVVTIAFSKPKDKVHTGSGTVTDTYWQWYSH